MSRRGLSSAAGLSDSLVSKIEAGGDPALSTFARLAMTLGMTPPEVWAVIVHEAARPTAHESRNGNSPTSTSPGWSACKGAS